MRRHLASATVVLSAVLTTFGVLAGSALADGTSTSATSPLATSTPATSAASAATGSTTTGTTPSATAPAAKASAGQAHLYLVDAFYLHRSAVTVPGRMVEVQGFVRPYVAGQTVQIQAFVGKRLFKTDQLRIKPDGTRLGAFTERLVSPSAGIVRVRVTHARTAQMLGFFAQRAYAALNTQTGPGASGLLVSLIQQRLAALHLYMPQTGVFDQQTSLALDAYHRLLGWGEGNQSADPKTIAALLDGRGAFHVRFPTHGRHAEGDLSDQVLALVDGSKVTAIYPISSGKPSTPTVLGDFHVYDRVPGYLPDGMYYSDFFYSGYAIHGYDPAPDYRASHGCMRLPISDAISVFDWLNYGDWVDVYYT